MNVALQKAKGPAEVAASPSHGSKLPIKEIPMNVHTDITDAPNPTRGITRRAIFAAVPAVGLAAIVPAAAMAVAVRDPLFDAINDYRDGMAEYCARPEFATVEEEDAAIAETYGPSFKVLDNWERPAQSMIAAREALRLVLDEQLLTGGMAEALVTAALAFLDGEALA